MTQTANLASIPVFLQS
jgi:pyruvate kinase